jgi:hypothetical protein
MRKKPPQLITMVADPDRCGLPTAALPTGVSGLNVYTIRTETMFPVV